MNKPYLSLTELLAGLAEECSELAQAALKLRRVYDGTNPTPTQEDVAIEHFEEEIADVNLYLKQINYSHANVMHIMQEKDERWKNRIGHGGD